MSTIYLIRHGQASFGAENYDKLSELGRGQAEITGQYLRDCGIQFDAVYSGELSRQRDTARLAIASQNTPPPHHVDARFDEINIDEQIEHLLPIVMQRDTSLRELVETRGISKSKDYQKAVRGVFNHWVLLSQDHPEIQSWRDYSKNVHNALSQLIRQQGRGKTVGIFTSGGTIATIVSHVLGVSAETIYQFYEPTRNCAVTQLFYNENDVSLSYFNDTSFLQVLGQQLGENLITYR